MMNPGIHRAMARIPQTSFRTTRATPFTCKRQSPLQYSLYSTVNSSTSNVSSSPSSKAPSPSSSSSRFSNWIQRITLMSASAAAGAFVYAKLDPAIGGFSGLPVGKLQPTILGTEEPDEPFNSATPVTKEKAKELKKSVLLEHEMHQLELVHQYKDKVAAGEWKEADPYFFLTDHTKKHNLTAGALRGENMLSVPPLKFERKDKKAIVLFLHLGRSLCGHDKIIHGGLLATLLGLLFFISLLFLLLSCYILLGSFGHGFLPFYGAIFDQKDDSGMVVQNKAIWHRNGGWDDTCRSKG